MEITTRWSRTRESFPTPLLINLNNGWLQTTLRTRRITVALESVELAGRHFAHKLAHQDRLL